MHMLLGIVHSLALGRTVVYEVSKLTLKMISNRFSDIKLASARVIFLTKL